MLEFCGRRARARSWSSATAPTGWRHSGLTEAAGIADAADGRGMRASIVRPAFVVASIRAMPLRGDGQAR
jgi:hypothetical protein